MIDKSTDNNFGKKVIILLFMTAIWAIMLINIMTPEKEFSPTENRVLETKPELALDDILSGDYQQTYENYLNDQFIARDRLVDVAVGIARAEGNRDVNGVYIGKDGYLLEKYTDQDFDKQQVEDNVCLLGDYLNRMTDRFGAEHVSCLLVPGKAAALPEKLPAYAGAYENELTDMLLEQLEEPDILLDLTETMQEHQDEYIYYRTDHHWTTLGAWYAYGAWAEKDGLESGDITAFERETFADEFYGTTYNKVHVRVEPDQVELFHGPMEATARVDKNDGETLAETFYFPEETEDELDKYRIFFGGNTAKIAIDTGSQAGAGKTLLVLKDSYANCFVPFLASHYERIIMLDLRYCSDMVDDLMAQEPDITDVMVLYNFEKFMQDDHQDLLEEIAED